MSVLIKLCTPATAMEEKFYNEWTDVNYPCETHYCYGYLTPCVNSEYGKNKLGDNEVSKI